MATVQIVPVAAVKILPYVVPVGTRAIDNDTKEVLGDLTKHGAKMLVAKGGYHGLGNTRFKSSVNRAPRQKTMGTPGEKRDLLLELMLACGCRACLVCRMQVNQPLFVPFQLQNQKLQIIHLPL